ncbi:MAG: exonuclease SbcCD subunit D [Eubacterium sp.]
MKNTKINKRQRNILIAHQYVSGATRCDSENMPIGGIDEVSAKNFEGFDYVALGHLHGPQHIEKETIRYAGTPLKYSFSEINHKKSALIVDVKKKGDVEFEKIPLKPLHDMVEIKGLYDELTAKSFYEDMDTKSYIHVTLTDEEDKPNAMELLRTIYPNIMKLDYDNKRTRENQVINGVSEIENKSKQELFEEFFELQNNQKMSDKQRKIIDDLINKIWG